ncbi:hypothetical protein SAMN05421507_12094 [Lentzea jiangxiensis]|uniref:Uncharacterized protein n=1 Tax=Lentzea jiangxiensis TaxID=641025 RepID=A0A1H0WM30_9PSEU|nr:hypothetical protein SAMN05421507_12094 [Lentzea jiangxiensis]
MCPNSPDNHVLLRAARCILGLPADKTSKREVQTEMNFAAKLRARRAEARNRKAVARAIDMATTPSMRHELMAIAQAQVTTLR